MDFLIHHMLRNSAPRYAEKEAVVRGIPACHIAKLPIVALRLRAHFGNAGMLRGDRVGIYLDPSVGHTIRYCSSLNIQGLVGFGMYR